MTPNNQAPRWSSQASAPYPACTADVAVALPGWVDRGYAAPVDGAAGVTALDMAPAGCGLGRWDVDRLRVALDDVAKGYGVAVRVRLEKGLGPGCGLPDEAVAFAAVAAAIDAAAGRTPDEDAAVRRLCDVTAITERRARVLVAGRGRFDATDNPPSQVAIVIADSKADGAVIAAARRAMRAAGAATVGKLEGAATLVACGGPDMSGRAVMQAGIDAFAMAGVWPRGRSGAPGQGLRITALEL